jgi:hypothetical protein
VSKYEPVAGPEVTDAICIGSAEPEPSMSAAVKALASRPDPASTRSIICNTTLRQRSRTSVNLDELNIRHSIRMRSIKSSGLRV